MKHNRIALIPARGGSKRLPKKNKLPFLGKPMISYSIEAAQAADLFDEIIVSTDDEDIANIAKHHHVKVVWREPELATDTITVTEVCIEFLKKQLKVTPDLQQLCVLYATAPLRSNDDIISVVKLLNKDCPYALAVTNYYYDVHQALVCENDSVKPVFPKLINFQSEKVPEFCVDNGSTYAVDVKHFIRDKTFFGPGLRVYFMPHHRSIDINDQYDFNLATYIAQKELSCVC